VIDATYLLCSHAPIHEHAGGWCKRSTLPLKFGKFRRRTDFRCELKVLTIYAKKHAELGFADARRVGENGLKHRLKVPRRTRNYLENLRRRCLLFQGFGKIARALAQFIEQPHVLDGDRGLVGEGLEQCNLSLSEKLRLGATQ